MAKKQLTTVAEKAKHLVAHTWFVKSVVHKEGPVKKDYRAYSEVVYECEYCDKQREKVEDGHVPVEE